MWKIIFIGIIALKSSLLTGQKTDANIFGDVKSEGEHMPFVSISLEGTVKGTTTDATGHYLLVNLPEGDYNLVASSVGYKTQKKKVTIVKGVSIEVNFELDEEFMSLNNVVVTGTRTVKRQTDSPVIVNILDSKTLSMTQACNISEGLKFQPGLRVETDCQTCNYTQLRMNGLAGSYSQILINGRPVFSPLTGLYGMEQIPSNMVERIEVVRGAGSALYGSSAIGGTVNIITKIPSESGYDFGVTTQIIGGGGNDVMFNGNINALTAKRNAGSTVFITSRRRDSYDQNGDRFSELPELKSNSFGVNFFLRPNNNQKLEMNLTSIYEYRYGGDMDANTISLARQAEERTHNVLMGGIDYQINFNQDNSSFIFYAAGQQTGRNHFTGVSPDDPLALASYQINPPYGKTLNSTWQAGSQFNHKVERFLTGPAIITVGIEYLTDKVQDSIPVYNYNLNQSSRNSGAFGQLDWEIIKGFTFLSGIRADKSNFVDKIIISPRVSLMYKIKTSTQFRVTWGQGFRAPQAFDTDMHIAFAGGGVSRIFLSPGLKEERSNSLGASVNYDKTSKTWIAGFTLEGFYTKLNNVFYLFPAGNDAFGDLFEKRNGTGAIVAGSTLELRGNFNKKVQVETGFTLQKSEFEDAVETIPGLPPGKPFLRSPEKYGYMTLTLNFTPNINAAFTSVYTGPMILAHFAGAQGVPSSDYVKTDGFFEAGFKFGFTIPIENNDSAIEIFAGIKNITNSYQNDFDLGKNRDSNYIYGPSAPRTFSVGIKLKSL